MFSFANRMTNLANSSHCHRVCFHVPNFLRWLAAALPLLLTTGLHVRSPSSLDFTKTCFSNFKCFLIFLNFGQELSPPWNSEWLEAACRAVSLSRHRRPGHQKSSWSVCKCVLDPFSKPPARMLEESVSLIPILSIKMAYIPWTNFEVLYTNIRTRT